MPDETTAPRIRRRTTAEPDGRVVHGRGPGTRDPDLEEPGVDPDVDEPDEEPGVEQSEGEEFDDAGPDQGGRWRARWRSLGENLWGGVKEILIIAVMAMVLSFVVKTWLLQAFYIPSGSMQDTLVKDDRVIVSKLTPRPVDLQRGDVVVFQDPANWLGPPPPVPAQNGIRGAAHQALQFIGLLPDDSEGHLIKRVIGLPGDHVVCCGKDGKLSINGVEVTENYIRAGDTPSGGRPPFDITVPPGRVWVMGDNRSDSSDSRFHDDGTGATGSVPIADITGRAVTIVWPIEHVTWLSVPERVYAAVPAPGSPPLPNGAATTPPTGPTP